MRKPGLAIAATVSMISATLLATQARAVTLGARTGLRAAMAAVDTSEQVFYCGCRAVNCGCWRPHYSYYRPYYPPPCYDSNYDCERPRRYYSYYYDPGPFREPLELNWGYRTRWADGFSQY
jgi:hypothetical protein